MPVAALNPTVFRMKSPLPVEIVNTGMAEGAVTPLSRTSRSEVPPAAWQLAAICAKRVAPVRSRVSARQMRPLVAAGKSVSTAPPLGTKTILDEIGEPMSEPAFEVVDQTAGTHCGF